MTTTDTTPQRVHPTSTLAFRLWVVLTLIFIATYASISAIVLHSVWSYLQNSAQQRLEVLASERLARIRDEFAHDQTNLRAWAALGTMDDLVTGDVDKRIVVMLDQMKNQYHLSGNIYAFDATGRLVASSSAHIPKDSMLPQRWRTALAQRRGFIDKHANPYGGGDIVAFVAPIYASFLPGSNIGTLVLTLPWTSVSALLAKGNTPLVVLDKDGNDRVLYSGVKPDVLSSLIEDLKNGKPAFRAAGATFLQAQAERGLDANKSPSMAGEHWLMVAVSPLGNLLYGPMAVAWRWIAVCALLLGAAMFTLILWLFHHLVRPITSLTRTTLSISESTDLSKRIAVTAHDEIGLLQQAFNRMTARLEQTFQENEKSAQTLRILNEKLEALAMIDSLTGLPNRYALGQYLTSAIARASRDGNQVAVGLLDLDDFKPVNDTHGHAAGDQLLQEISLRLRSLMRETDMLARLGGDEFVVVLDRVDATQTIQILHAILARLHRVIEKPFDLENGAQAEVGMSMGLAIYPLDGTDGDTLLRQADLALYAAKANKVKRTHWWRMIGSSLATPVDDEPIDPYGSIAAELLRKAAVHWQGMETEFVEQFYARLDAHPESARILGFLSPAELAHLKERQAQHLKQLLDPNLQASEHDRVAEHLGRIHAMAGIEAAGVMAAMNEYAIQLQQAIQRLPWRSDSLLALRTVLQARLPRELQGQQTGRDQIEQERQARLVSLETSMPGWIQANHFPEQLAAHLATLPCMKATAIGRPDANYRYIPEFTAGCSLDQLRELCQAGMPSSFDDSGPASRSPMLRAWSTGQIESAPCRELGMAPEALEELAQGTGIRSLAAVPIVDFHGHTILVISLFGAYPGQFHSRFMRIFLESLQHLVTPAFLRFKGAANRVPIDVATRQHMHALLFQSRLRMVVQPLVDLETGKVDRVEMLARLVDGDRVLNPGQFLPAFGQHELQVLFRKGLQQTVALLKAWDELGLHIDGSLNLPPSVLIAPDCLDWIEAELQTSGLMASRLYLELLETEDDASGEELRDAAIAKLAKLGVRLIMDDLGSGYSSLSRLRTLPFHAVKIDQNLVLQAQSDPERTIPFISSLVRMAQGLGLQVTIEGLETPDLVEMAVGTMAEHGQGYGLARPMEADAFTDWLRQWRWSVDPLHPQTALGKHALLFRQAASPLDWQRIINDHLRYKDEILQTLRSHHTPIDWRSVSRSDACRLGRWLRRQESIITAQLRPLFERAKEEHATFHRKVGELVRRAQSDPAAASAIIADIERGGVDTISERLVNTLHELSSAIGQGHEGGAVASYTYVVDEEPH